VEQVADPGFVQGATMAQVLGTMAMRMANADILPFRPQSTSSALAQSVVAAQGMLERRDPAMDASVMNELQAAAMRAIVSSFMLQERIDERLAAGTMSTTEASALNDHLARLEQLLTDDEGPDDRRWFRHVVHGWDIYSLYDGQPFPGLAEAIRRNDAARIDVEVARIKRALERWSRGVGAAQSLVPPS
jgi:N-acetylated-alpha-linked acidic dipeptidase